MKIRGGTGCQTDAIDSNDDAICVFRDAAEGVLCPSPLSRRSSHQPHPSVSLAGLFMLTLILHHLFASW
ncbi:hypothetical protein Rcae01_05805 [Novipirellula caenicola]|uniref:Uncharacterized protein n=1 Tax=Novipirellula caenicola TaxID=1536901 RepID=A0ABP9VYU0_9BACT